MAPNPKTTLTPTFFSGGADSLRWPVYPEHRAFVKDNAGMLNGKHEFVLKLDDSTFIPITQKRLNSAESKSSIAIKAQTSMHPCNGNIVPLDSFFSCSQSQNA